MIIKSLESVPINGGILNGYALLQKQDGAATMSLSYQAK